MSHYAGKITKIIIKIIIGWLICKRKGSGAEMKKNKQNVLNVPVKSVYKRLSLHR